MDQHHTYDFVEGCVPRPIAPEIKGFYSTSDTYYGYYDPSSPDSVSQALSQLDAYLDVEGPFDGVIAFSQGTALLSSYLIKHGMERPGSSLPFRCAIFFSGVNPVDVRSLGEDEYRLITEPTPVPLLNLPTGHIWGRADMTHGEGAELLCSVSQDTQREVFVHEGGHTIPGPRNKQDVQGCVRVIRRTIERALIE